MPVSVLTMPVHLRLGLSLLRCDVLERLGMVLLLLLVVLLLLRRLPLRMGAGLGVGVGCGVGLIYRACRRRAIRRGEGEGKLGVGRGGRRPAYRGPLLLLLLRLGSVELPARRTRKSGVTERWWLHAVL